MKRCLLRQNTSNKLTLKHLREEAIEHLLSSPFLCKNVAYERINAVLDVDVLLCFLLKKSKAYLLAHLDEYAFEINNFYKMLEMRYCGTSIAYIIGEKEFYGLKFSVNPSVLIPKSDTETLVEVSIKAIEDLLYKRRIGECIGEYELNILDVFSGSGCVGIATVHSLLSKLKDDNCIFCIHCSFLDVSSEAIEVSRFNAKKLLPDFIQTHLSFFCQDARQRFPLKDGKKYDVIMANPPYVSQKDTGELLSDGRSEPALALDGGADGFAFFASLAKNAREALKDGGTLFCEVGDGQAEEVLELFAKTGFVNTKSYYDLSQKKRVVKGEALESLF